MISNQIGNKTIYVSRGSPNNNRETVERETEKKVLDTEIPKERYTSSDHRQRDYNKLGIVHAILYWYGIVINNGIPKNDKLVEQCTKSTM